MKTIENTEKVFKDGIYVICSNDNITVGDIVELTTADFDFDAVTGKFEKTSKTFEIEAEIVEEDLTGYIPSQSTNGGAYGYATAVVQSVEMI